MGRPPPLISLTADLAAAILATTVLTAMALQHDHLTTVGFVGAAKQAHLVDMGASEAGLYAWLLWAVHQVVGEIVSSGGLLSVFAGVGTVVVATRMLGPWAGLWLLAQVAVLEASTIPGPSMLVSMCVLWSIYAAAEQKELLCGLWLAASMALAGWMWPFAMVVVWFSGRMLNTVVVTASTLGLLYGLGCSIDFHIMDMGTSLSMWKSATLPLVTDWMFWLGGGALVWGFIRGNRASKFFLVLAVMGVLCLVQFQQPDGLLLLLSVVVMLGVAAIETGPALLVFSMVLLGFRLPAVWDGTEEKRGLQSVIRATASNPQSAWCTTSTFIRPAEQGGWLRHCTHLSELGRAATDIHLVDVKRGLQQSESTLLAVEEHAVLHTYPWLQDLLSAPYPPGFELVSDASGWAVFSVSP